MEVPGVGSGASADAVPDRQCSKRLVRQCHLPGDPGLWPPCLQLCGILPQDLAKGASEDDQRTLVLAVHTMFRAVACMHMQEEGNSEKMFDIPRVPPGA